MILKNQGDCNKTLLHEITFKNKRENMDEIYYLLLNFKQTMWSTCSIEINQISRHILNNRWKNEGP